MAVLIVNIHSAKAEGYKGNHMFSVYYIFNWNHFYLSLKRMNFIQIISKTLSLLT